MNILENCDRPLFIITLSLVVFGLIMVFGTSGPISQRYFHNSTHIFLLQLTFAILGLALMLGMLQIPIKRLLTKKIVYILVFFSIGLLAIALKMPPVKGTHRWIHLMGISIQPSEITKLVFVIFLAWYFAYHDNIREKPFIHLLKISMVAVPIAALIVKEPDMGNAVLILVLMLVFLFLSDFPLRYLTAIIGVSAVLVGVFIISSSYRLQRIMTFLSPGSDIHGKGYQIYQSIIAIAHSGFWGLGPGQSTQKLFFLPEPHTDFIFSVIAEEWGFIGCFVLIMAFALIFYRGLKIANHLSNDLYRWLVIGIVCMITIQALVNISVVINLAPTKGIPLPFISKGGSSLIMVLVSMGFVLNISKEVEQ